MKLQKRKDRKTDRDKEKQRHLTRERHIEKKTDSKRDRQQERQTARETDSKRDRQRHLEQTYIEKDRERETSGGQMEEYAFAILSGVNFINIKRANFLCEFFDKAKT